MITVDSILPQEIIDKDIVSKIRINGRGGKEVEISKLFKNAKIIDRVNNGIYDFQIQYEGETYYIEVKKQEQHQWFDIGKYYNLSEQDRKIIILFIMHKKGKIVIIAAIGLADFLDVCTNDIGTRTLGWTEEVIKVASEFKTKYPALQFKVKAYINKLIEDYLERFNILYNYVETIIKEDSKT